MKPQINHSFGRVSALVLSVCFSGAIPTICLAETCVSNPGTGPDICVGWSNPGNPDLGTDFIIDFTDAANPGVQLKTGDTVWNVRSDDGGSPGNIGDITLDPTVSTVDFNLTILNGTNPGATNVRSIALTAANWTGSSSIDGGEITGNLTGGLTVVKDAEGNGGAVSGDFTIDGDVSGDIVVAVISATLTIVGDLSADIDVTGKIDGGILTVGGGVTAPVRIEVADMVNSSTLQFNTTGPGTSDFAGDLFLQSGVPLGQFVNIDGLLTSTGSIDLNGQDVAGWLGLAGGSGSLINGGTVTGLLWLAGPDAGGNPGVFSGTATVAGVDGTIRLEGGNLDGTINVTGDVAGTVMMGPGDILSNGRVAVAGDLDGTIRVSTAITFGGQVAGDIDIGGDVNGLITIDESLKSTGRILIDGLCDGDIKIGEQTESLSLIRMIDGLGSEGTVTVNDSEGDFDANGTIHVGGVITFGAVTFDGSIMIKKESGSDNGGDLDGRITVRGCHSTADDLDICICGDNNGRVSIIQGGCANQVDWSCVTGCS